jgi:hypothetical protein
MPSCCSALLRRHVVTAIAAMLALGITLPSQADQPAAAPKPPAAIVSNAAVSSTPPNDTKEVVVSVSARPAWDDQLVKTLSGSGFSLVSLSFAAFTFLFGALVGLRNDKDQGDSQHFTELQTKLAFSVYWIAATVVVASAITFLANVAVAFQSRVAGLISISLAALLLLAIPGLVSYLAHDVYKRRSAS